MLKTSLKDCQEFLAGDHTWLRELLHPDRSKAKVHYSLAQGRLESGQRSKWHRLTSSEVYYFLTGVGVMLVDDRAVDIESGSTVYVPPGAKQSLRNTGAGAIEFLCLVDPAWRLEDEDVLE
ncbi:MAG: cupin domain-containing protein [Nitrospiraceae bacterium]